MLFSSTSFYKTIQLQTLSAFSTQVHLLVQIITVWIYNKEQQQKNFTIQRRDSEEETRV